MENFAVQAIITQDNVTYHPVIFGLTHHIMWNQDVTLQAQSSNGKMSLVRIK